MASCWDAAGTTPRMHHTHHSPASPRCICYQDTSSVQHYLRCQKIIRYAAAVSCTQHSAEKGVSARSNNAFATTTFLAFTRQCAEKDLSLGRSVVRSSKMCTVLYCTVVLACGCVCRCIAVRKKRKEKENNAPCVPATRGGLAFAGCSSTRLRDHRCSTDGSDGGGGRCCACCQVVKHSRHVAFRTSHVVLRTSPALG